MHPSLKIQRLKISILKIQEPNAIFYIIIIICFYKFKSIVQLPRSWFSDIFIDIGLWKKSLRWLKSPTSSTLVGLSISYTLINNLVRG